jgi:hypothetical protein
MSLDKDQIKELLGTGLSNDVVARAVGCDSSYISQLMSSEDFATEVVALRTKALTDNTVRDKKIDSLEDKLIDRLETAIDSNQIYKPTDILRAFNTVNAAKRRGVPSQEHLTSQQTIVNLQLPVVVINKFVTNSQGEVVEAEGKTLVTMSSSRLLQKLATERGVDGERYAELRKFLPPAIETGTGSDKLPQNS